MAHLKIGPHRFLDVRNAVTHTVLSPTTRVAEPADVADLIAADHLTWWHSPEAVAYRTGARFEHSTGLVSRWSLVTSTQGRYWIALEVWADSKSKTSSKQTLPRHLHPTAYLAQLDGIAFPMSAAA